MFQFTPHQWRTVLRSGVYVAILSTALAAVAAPGDRSRLVGAGYGLTVGALAFVLVLVVREWVWNSSLVHLRFGLFSLINFTLNAIAIVVAVRLAGTPFGIQPGTTAYLTGLAFAVALSGWFAVDRFLGKGVLIGLLLGRYHHPRYENRVFLFADLADSTPLAQRLGDLRYHEFLNTLIVRIGPAIDRHGGWVHRYLGDEIIVTWPWSSGTDDATCLRCAVAILESIREAQSDFEEEFAEVPRMRIALHGGQVVAGEITGIKREIVFSGDAVNTTARIESVAGELDRDLVISRELLDEMDLPDGLACEDLGSFRLKGRAEDIALLAVTGTSG